VAPMFSAKYPSIARRGGPLRRKRWYRPPCLAVIADVDPSPELLVDAAACRDRDEGASGPNRNADDTLAVYASLWLPFCAALSEQLAGRGQGAVTSRPPRQSWYSGAPFRRERRLVPETV
jgi:hypothetical protein